MSGRVGAIKASIVSRLRGVGLNFNLRLLQVRVKYQIASSGMRAMHDIVIKLLTALAQQCIDIIYIMTTFISGLTGRYDIT